MAPSPASYVLINLSPKPELAGGRVELVGRPGRENLITRGQRDPGLLAAGPDMPCRLQPRGIVERARAHPDHAVPRLAADPGTALRTHQAVWTATVGRSLDASRLNPAQTKGSLGYDNPHRESAAGYPLTVGAVAGVNLLRGLSDLVADLAAMTAAGLRSCIVLSLLFRAAQPCVAPAPLDDLGGRLWRLAPTHLIVLPAEAGIRAADTAPIDWTPAFASGRDRAQPPEISRSVFCW